MKSKFPDHFDFTNCEDEPIRTPGAIQPHGFVIFLDPDSLGVCGASENAGEFIQRGFGDEAAAFTARQPGLPESLADQVRQNLSSSAGQWPVAFTLAGYHFSLTLRDQRLMLCGEPDDTARHVTVADLTSLIARIKSARGVDELLDTAVQAVRSITGYDRVMVYRFAEDWHGEVVAEDHASHMTGYLGLHFPASDISAQARALCLENEIRMIADVDAEMMPMVNLSGQPADERPDLTDCPLRAMSPIHLQYLRNMGVAASMSISLIRDNRLWGLIACHHTSPRYTPVGARLSSKLVGDVLSLYLKLVENSDLMEHRLRRRLYQSAVLEKCLKSDELVPTIVKSAGDFFRLFDADSFAVYERGRVVSCGDAPDNNSLVTLAESLGQRMQANDSSRLAFDASESEIFAGQHSLAPGILVLAPSHDYQVLCIWMRKEQPMNIDWAGRDHKKTDDPLNSRASFDRWSEKRSGQSRPWKNWELEAADDLLTALQRLALREMERLQRLSENLVRSNRDLEDFAFIASHDLQEPLRKIEAFSGMITEELEQDSINRVQINDYLSRVTIASARLRSLVSDLLTYSRVGRLDYDFGECHWEQVIRNSIDLIEQAQNYTEFDITVTGEFPVTRASPVLLRMIFQNLVSNALKYGDPDRRNHITVTGEKMAGGARWRVVIEDTGIGFDPDQAEAIFKPFLRLHSKSRYPGSGIGLAIVRKAADRLGVGVSAQSTPGQGSVFSVITAD